MCIQVPLIRVLKKNTCTKLLYGVILTPSSVWCMKHLIQLSIQVVVNTRSTVNCMYVISTRFINMILIVFVEYFSAFIYLQL